MPGAAPPEKIEFNALDVPLLALGVAVSLAYALTKRWVLANVLAAAFSLCALEMLTLGSFQIGAGLLVRRRSTGAQARVCPAARAQPPPRAAPRPPHAPLLAAPAPRWRCSRTTCSGSLAPR